MQIGTSQATADRAPLLDKVANRAYELVLENSFDRGDELDADKVSVDLTTKVGYVPASLAEFLTRLDDRNKNQPEKNGLFASHPESKERIEKVKAMGSASRNTALVEARYKTSIKYEASAITSIAPAAGGPVAASGSTKDDKDAVKEEPKKQGFGLGNLKQTVTPEKSSTQVSASGGARGVGPDRAAKGGDNSTIVKTTVSETELASFKKGIA